LDGGGNGEEGKGCLLIVCFSKEWGNNNHSECKIKNNSADNHTRLEITKGYIFKPEIPRKIKKTKKKIILIKKKFKNKKYFKINRDEGLRARSAQNPEKIKKNSKTKYFN
jgi:hypothetical protein